MHVDDKAGVGVFLPGGGGENEGLSVQLSFVECHVVFATHSLLIFRNFTNEQLIFRMAISQRFSYYRPCLGLGPFWRMAVLHTWKAPLF